MKKNVVDFIGGYSITFTLKPDLYRYKAITQYKKSHASVIEVLRTLADYYILIPELTKQCNVHYHCIVIFRKLVFPGQIEIHDLIKKYKSLGTVYVNPEVLNNEERVKATLEYILEDYDITKHKLQLKDDILEEWEYKPPPKRKLNLTVDQLDKLNNWGADLSDIGVDSMFVKNDTLHKIDDAQMAKWRQENALAREGEYIHIFDDH